MVIGKLSTDAPKPVTDALEKEEPKYPVEIEGLVATFESWNTTIQDLVFFFLFRINPNLEQK